MQAWPCIRRCVQINNPKFIASYRLAREKKRLKKEEAIQRNLLPLGAENTVMWSIWAWSQSAFCVMVTGPVSVWQTKKRLEKDSLFMVSERKKKSKGKTSSDVQWYAQQSQHNSFPSPSHILSSYGKGVEGTWWKTHNSINHYVGKYGILEISADCVVCDAAADSVSEVL